MGLNNSQKAAVYSSIYGESRFNPYAYNPRGGGKGAHGIMQWRGARIPESSYLPSQMDYLENTLNSVDRMNWLSKRSLNNFKLFLLDVGLLGALSEMEPAQMLISNKAMTESKGAFTENYKGIPTSLTREMR